MKTHLNAIVIAVSILISSLLIIWRMPRYQYCTTEHISTDKDGNESHSKDSYVFDMVTGKLHRRGSWFFVSSDGQVIDGKHFNYEKPKHQILDSWDKRREVFGNECSFDEWTQWKKEHNW